LGQRVSNQDVLRLCFYRLRKDAGRGVDGVGFQDYERHLEENLADLVGQLKRKAYRARLVRRKYIPEANGKHRFLGILEVGLGPTTAGGRRDRNGGRMWARRGR
jgi:RNA-directed DNA polymerase